ncbi:Calcium-transporting ATPase type 2C member 1-like isoform X2 [Oopsacas minuta]|uniref:Calcium-transporting ATPase n=1 Tax=Oopsacas minuta TaxID=111878 RepID=A0AAV7JD67_9METZ|nr:Calcium-transporting ATPase type 2C member 1-like isoform X2 [Oopsacas minuta]
MQTDNCIIPESNISPTVSRQSLLRLSHSEDSESVADNCETLPLLIPDSSQQEIDPDMLFIKSSQACQYSVDAIITQLRVSQTQGLSHNDVIERRRMAGWNEFQEDPSPPLWLRYLEQFKDPLILLLLVSAVVSLLMRQFDDAFSITAAILIVVTVAFVQEYRSEKSLEALKRLVPYKCHVLREAKPQVISARELVPGDIVLLQAGDRVPADVRLFDINSFSVDESGFTGESKVSAKSASVVDKESDFAERLNISYMGTLVRTGNAKGVVIGTGEQSEFGEIFRAMQQEEAPKTPLQRNMASLGKQLSVISLVIIGLILLLGWIQGRPLLEMFTIAVSLAVAAIPEGLPIVVTVTLALGVMRMANRKAIVKKLPTVETLGCATVVCTDKTGTLTLNEMNVSQIYTSRGVHLTVDIGTSSMCDEQGGRVSLRETPDLESLVLAGTLCNNARIDADGKLLGQSTEGALLRLSQKLGVSHLRRSYKRLTEHPFSSESKVMSVLVSNINEPIKQLWYIKGALENVLPNCRSFFGHKELLTEEDREDIRSAALMMGRKSLRVLAVAQGPETDQLFFLGLFGIRDPIRPGVTESVNSLLCGGVKVKMVTGDARETAMSIARDLGLVASSLSEIESAAHIAVSGKELEDMDSRNKEDAINRAVVFYRVTPKLKIAIVRALQARKEVVAMTGDGTNDAIAVRGADIGVAMGKSGTDVCREAGDLILINDNFSTIMAAIEEGKGIFYNIRNFLRFQLSTSIAAIALIAIATLIGYPNPLNAMQILWINIIMDGPPAQSLGVEPVDRDVMNKPPRQVHKAVLSWRILFGAVLNAFVIVLGVMWVFQHEMQDKAITRRDTTMTFTCFVLCDMFNALSCRSQEKSVFQLGFFTNTTFLIAVGFSLFGQLMVIYFGPLQSIFQTEALTINDLLTLTAIASSVWLADEVRKLVVRCWRSHTSSKGKLYDY